MLVTLTMTHAWTQATLLLPLALAVALTAASLAEAMLSLPLRDLKHVLLPSCPAYGQV